MQGQNAAEDSGCDSAPIDASANADGEAGNDSDGDCEQTSEVTAAEFQDLKVRADERDTFLDELRRAKADFENLRKRMHRERPQLEEYGARAVLTDMLAVVDNFERALASVEGEAAVDDSGFRQGVELIHQQLLQLLTDHGVEEIEAVGTAFNPEFHEAMLQVEVDDRPTGEVVGVLQKGYTHRGVVMRPTKVQVSRNVRGDSEPQEGAEDAPPDASEESS